MVLHPEVQVKARSELDALTGQDRLPKFDDRPHLPYVEAVVKECIRWHTVAPTGEEYPLLPISDANFSSDHAAIPHRVVQDDIHKGYFLPKGTLVIPNIWSVF
jgi:cytochrome P450